MHIIWDYRPSQTAGYPCPYCGEFVAWGDFIHSCKTWQPLVLPYKPFEATDTTDWFGFIARANETMRRLNPYDGLYIEDDL